VGPLAARGHVSAGTSAAGTSSVGDVAAGGLALDGGHDQRGLVGGEDRLDHHHAVGALAARHGPAGTELLGRQRGVAPYGGELPTDQLELGGGGGERVHQQGLLGGRGGDAGDGADLGVRQATVAQRVVDARQGGEGARDPDVLAPGPRRPADAPRQPRGARDRAVIGPVAGLVERADVGEQAVHRGVQVIGLLRDAIAQLGPGGAARGRRVGAGRDGLGAGDGLVPGDPATSSGPVRTPSTHAMPTPWPSPITPSANACIVFVYAVGS
jgi:hypothetical protein